MGLEGAVEGLEDVGGGEPVEGLEGGEVVLVVGCGSGFVGWAEYAARM